MSRGVCSTLSDAPKATLSLNRVKQLVKESLSNIPNAPPINTVARPADIGLAASQEVPACITFRSREIYVFQSGIVFDLDALKTVFHELFHQGLSNLLLRTDYLQTVLAWRSRSSGTATRLIASKNAVSLPAYRARS
jgi:hypothetical protein